MRLILLLTLSVLGLGWPAAAAARHGLVPLASALERLAAAGEFSGAVVVRGEEGVRLAAAYGSADPFLGIPFETETLVDSGSLAKPMTAAALLSLVGEGRVDLDAPVARYVREFPHRETTVRHLLAHAAGLPDYAAFEPLAGKGNSALLAEIGATGAEPAFPPGSAFLYCNLCYDALALLVERVTGRGYEEFLRERIGLPEGAGLRPLRIADWPGRAVGFRRGPGGDAERYDSLDGEALYGGSNLSISAAALAEWGTFWWSPPEPLGSLAAAPVPIGDGMSGLALGSWYCASGRRRCHYLGHHQGFHHLLYWDADRRLSVAMVTNNALAPGLHQPLQRAILAFASGRPEDGAAELAVPLLPRAARPGSYRAPDGELVLLGEGAGPVLRLTRRGVGYDVYPVAEGIGYAPGLDAYVTGLPDGGLRLLSLYEDLKAEPAG